MCGKASNSVRDCAKHPFAEAKCDRERVKEERLHSTAEKEGERDTKFRVREVDGRNASDEYRSRRSKRGGTSIQIQS